MHFHIHKHIYILTKIFLKMGEKCKEKHTIVRRKSARNSLAALAPHGTQNCKQSAVVSERAVSTGPSFTMNTAPLNPPDVHCFIHLRRAWKMIKRQRARERPLW